MAKCARLVAIFGFFIYLTTLVASDPIDDYQEITYDHLNFISEMKINERNRMGLIRDCSGICSHYLNTFQLFNEEYIGTNANYCPGQLRNCQLYEAPEEISISASVYNFWNWLMWASGNEDTISFIHNRRVLLQFICPTCKCYCDDYLNPNLTGSICLDRVLSNVTDGYVVTGVRFKIIDKIVRIQIQQGKLVNNIIDSNTRHWQEVNVCKESKRMNYDNRSLLMDDIILPKDFVVTGVSLSLTQISKGFYLSVYGKPMHELKNVNVNETEFHSPPGNRINLMTPNMEIPTAGQGENVELSTPGQSLISFQTLGLTEDNDLNDPQLIPFLDIRDVISVNDAKLIRGVGIYWRGQKDYGGYIAFKLFVDKYSI
ncbi:uncharacterized protein [Chelonus insularis]|uniref:uncharacterized protein n=1 Tax=Chelonus insularis TaxID=460826 RepID=UPI00158B0596|nr:uncharacterized protein LOC118066990 [Chelonus insularis]